MKQEAGRHGEQWRRQMTIELQSPSAPCLLALPPCFCYIWLRIAMGFVTPALLGGAALVAVPIVLHLIMRREAQQLEVSRAAICAAAADAESASAAAAAFAAVGAAVRDHCAVGVRVGAADAARFGRGGQGRRADGHGAGVRQLAADAVRARESNATRRRRRSWPGGCSINCRPRAR